MNGNDFNHDPGSITYSVLQWNKKNMAYNTSVVATLQTRDIEQLLVQCWSIVYDAGRPNIEPTMAQCLVFAGNASVTSSQTPPTALIFLDDCYDTSCMVVHQIVHASRQRR